MTTGFAPVNGLQMYYEVHGVPNGKPPLLLIHGGGSTIPSNWEKVLPLFSKSRQVIALETQSHGRTRDIDRPFTFEQDADDVAALLKFLNIPRADIFGFSNGGQIAMLVAVRHREVAHKIVIGSIGYARDGFYPAFWDFMNQDTFEQMPQVLKNAFLEVTPDPNRLHTMWARDSYRMRSFQGWSDELIGTIQCPALIVSGDLDIVTPEHLVKMHRVIKGSRLIILPGGHGEYLGERSTGNAERQIHEAFVAMVDKFLDAK